MNNDYPDINASHSPDRYPILLISDQEERYRDFHDGLTQAGFPVSVCTPSSISSALDESVPAVVLMCCEQPSLEHMRSLCSSRPELPILGLTSVSDFSDALDLIEAGAWDCIRDTCSCEQLIDRIHCLTVIAGEYLTGMSDPEGLKTLCRRLCASNNELAQRFLELRDDLALVRSDHDAQLDITSTISAFKALLSQELGIEGVLQTALEFILGKTGPTNAAIFLADSPSSYSLGAYVNFDCPREKADPVLAKFAVDVCHHVAGPDDLVRFQDVDAFIEAVGSEAEILESSEIVGMPCSFDGECLAVVFLFRSNSEPFSEALAPLLDCLRGTLAEQLATIVSIHHRIEDHWPDESTDESSDWGFGTGGSKAA
ncbi:MAG: hypothetical protein VX641_06230 [Planctomycetota bacterium]|nr:hypothetical protein [Planctomycetota bacterium]